MMRDGRGGGRPPKFLSAGGEMGALMRAHDWMQSPLGPPAQWPDALKMAVSICLNSRFPMVLWWGREFVMLYNDAWRPILGAKHPKGLGRPGIETWPEIWDIIGEQLGSVLKRGEATWSEDLLLAVARYGYVEEAYFTYSYSPIKAADGRVRGVFTAGRESPGRPAGRFRRPEPADERRKKVLLGRHCRCVAATHWRRHPARFRPVRRCARPQRSDAVHSLGAALSIFAPGNTACRRGTARPFLRQKQSGRHDLGDRPH